MRDNYKQKHCGGLKYFMKLGAWTLWENFQSNLKVLLAHCARIINSKQIFIEFHQKFLFNWISHYFYGFQLLTFFCVTQFSRFFFMKEKYLFTLRSWKLIWEENWIFKSKSFWKSIQLQSLERFHKYFNKLALSETTVSCE